MDDLLLLEIEHLRQMLVIAALDLNENPGDYIHDLSTRDYYEEMKGEYNEE